MCVEIFLPDTQSGIDSIGALKELIAPVEIIFRDGYPADICGLPDSCLCPVDTEATAAAAGYSDADGSDTMERVWRKKP